MSYCTTSKSSDPPHIFHIDGQQVSLNNTFKDLGVIMTKNIDWSKHHQYILAKAYRMLNLLRRTFCVDNCHNGKKVLYLTLVRSRLTYSSPIWRPNLLRDISSLEKLQRRATKYILNDFSSNYKNRLTRLKIIPLMMFFEMMDILFFVSCLKHPSSHFNILNYVTFTNTSTRSSCCSKLMHHLSKTNKERHFYFHCLPRLWNSLPVINIQCSLKSIKRKLFIFLWNHFTLHFNPDIPAPITLFVPAPLVLLNQSLSISLYCSSCFVMCRLLVFTIRPSVHHSHNIILYHQVHMLTSLCCTVKLNNNNNNNT